MNKNKKAVSAATEHGNLLKHLIEIFTDEDDVVIDPCAGSGTTLRACMELNRNSYGFEVSKKFYRESRTKMLNIDPPIYDGTSEKTMFDLLYNLKNMYIKDYGKSDIYSYTDLEDNLYQKILSVESEKELRELALHAKLQMECRERNNISFVCHKFTSSRKFLKDAYNCEIYTTFQFRKNNQDVTNCNG